MDDPARHAALARHLSEFDEACPSCGYALRGLTGERCPECNQPLVLRVQLAEPRMGALMAALVPLISGAGASAILMIAVGWMCLQYGPPPSRVAWTIFGVPSLCLASMGAAGVAVGRTRGRVWLRNLDATLRRCVITVCWLALLLFVIWFISGFN